MKRALQFMPNLLLAAVLAVVSVSCSEDEPAPNLSTDCEIISFSVDDEDWDIAGTNITHVYPAYATATSLAPTITLSPGATVNPLSGVAQDFFTAQGITYTVTAEDGVTTKTYTVRATKEQFDYQTEKTRMKDSFKSMLALANQIDAAMTHEADLPGFAAYMNFTFDASDSKLDGLWNEPYRVVQSANSILNQIDRLAFDSEEEKMTYKAEAYYYRAYAYSVLLNYFGGPVSQAWGDGSAAWGVPIIMDDEPSGDEPRNTQSEVVELILADCDRAMTFASVALRCAASQIKTRVLLQKGDIADFPRAYQASQENLNMCQAAGYGLPANLEWGGIDAIGEGISYSADEYPAVMRKGDVVYPVRYVETLLLCAEAANENGIPTEAIGVVNQIAQAKGQLPTLSMGATQEEIREAIINLYSSELNREGFAFAFLKRTGRFMQILGQQYGAQEKHQMLPVPASVMNSNPNILQSPGYL
jgi:hypothetical protein